MKRLINLAAGVLLSMMVVGCTSTPKPSKAQVLNENQELSEFQNNLQSARADNVDFFAPDGFKRAQKEFDAALENAVDGDAFSENIDSGMRVLQKAEKNARESKTFMREVLAARERAIDARANELLPEAFSELDARLQDNMRLLEKGKEEEAREARGELITKYNALELKALERATVTPAQEMISKAKESDADDLAPKTFALAEKELSLALSILRAERTEQEKASEHVARSKALAERAIYIADIVKLYKQRDLSNEDIVLWYQEQLTNIHRPLPEPLHFTKSNYEVVTGFENDIKGILTAEAEARNELQIAQNKNQILLNQISRLKEENIAVSMGYKGRLEEIEMANVKAQERYEKVQNMFSLDEAEVYRQGHNVLLTTYGFDFLPGQSEIKSDNFDLLHKITEAINTFENPYVLVMGHTDSTGSEDNNMALSIKRAETVASFLKKVGKMPDEKVNSEGYGESRPVATNETKEGRAKNRRIEILIINKK